MSLNGFGKAEDADPLAEDVDGIVRVVDGLYKGVFDGDDRGSLNLRP